jgi:hypothetical protein
VVDEYHLEILRGSDLMGRWYLADVEARRDIAERFTLFLGDDEMEFLADDALVFAYEGVTRMQEGWVRAKKRKRRHRRAAADAARRKDEAPLEPEPMTVAQVADRREPDKPKAPTSDLAKKLAAIASAEAAATEEKRRYTWAEAEALEEAAATPPPPVERKPRKKAPVRDEEALPQPPAPKPRTKKAAPAYNPPTTEPYKPPPAAVSEPEPTPAAQPTAELPETPAPPPPQQVEQPPKRKRAPKPPPEEVPEPEYPEPSWIAPPPARVVTVDLSVEEPVVTETPLAAPPEPLPAPEPAAFEPEPQVEQPDDELGKRRQRRRSRKEAAETDPATEGKQAGEVTDLEAARAKTKASRTEGHHPAETNVGLLAKLRRPPKTDNEHVHTYQESRSSGGLTRRVCLECSHVSITSDD